MDLEESRTSAPSEKGVAYASITEKYELKIREPGAYKLSPRCDMHFLDIQVGGTNGQYSVGEAEPRTDTSPMNSFVFLPSNDNGKIAAIRTGWSVQLMFLPERLERVIDALWPNTIIEVSPIWHAHDEALLGIARSLKDVVCTCVDPTPDEFSEAFVTGLLVGTALQFRIQRSDDTSHTANVARVQVVLNYIEHNLDKPLLVEELAALVNISPYHFARMFRSVMYSSVHQYVVGRRLEHARIMLLRSDMNISRISYECGFGSQSHMTTVFKKTFGTTPGAMRRDQSRQ